MTPKPIAFYDAIDLIRKLRRDILDAYSMMDGRTHPGHINQYVSHIEALVKRVEDTIKPTNG